MPIVGLSSLRNDNNDEDDNNDDDDRLYVGGVGARGGGSGLEVLPNRDENSGPASDAIFNQAEAAGAPPSGGGGGEVRRTITMYRSGFTVDDGPHRRLDDPTNAEFLRNLARGMIPSELRREAQQAGGPGGEVLVGLVDKRGEEYDPSQHQACGCGDGGGGFESFSGEGQTLSGGTAAAAAAVGGVIDPADAGAPAPLDGARPATSIAVRLLNGKRVIVKVNLDAPVSEIGQHVGAQAGDEPYVLTSGYPPAAIEDLTQTVEEAGLKGAQVVVKKA